MAGSVVGGSVIWNLDVVDQGFSAGLVKAKAEAEAFGGSLKNIAFKDVATQAQSAFNGVADALGGVLKVGAVAGTVVAAGLTAATFAAFDQVRQVQNASFALRAYETDANKVNMVLSQLVAFARSDLGVLFQREDLFKAASTLRAFGESADTITDKVKILARGVALGNTTFEELSLIVGRSAQSGRLTAEAYDQLAFRGIILDKSLRGAAVSSDQLFQELSRVLPEDLLRGRANTIDGVFIRLQSAFRDLGSAILGVDKDTSQFIKGGLGDRFLQILDQVRITLKDPALIGSLQRLGQGIADFAAQAVPLVINVFKFMVDHASDIVAFFAAIAAGFVAAKVGAIAFGIALDISTGGITALIKLIVLGVVALVAALAFLQAKFGIFNPLIDVLKSVYNAIQLIVTGDFKGGIFGLTEDSPAIAALLKLHEAVVFVIDVFKQLFKFVAEQAKPIIEMIKNNEQLRTALIGVGIAIATIVLVPILALVAAFAAVVAIVGAVLFVINKVVQFFQFLNGVAQQVNQAIINFFIGLGNVIAGVFNQIVQVYNATLKPVVDAIVAGFTVLFNIVSTIFGAIFTIIFTIVSTIAQIIFVIFQGIFNFIVQQILTPLFNFIASIFQAIYNAIAPPIQAAFNFIVGVFTGIFNFVVGIINGVVNFVRSQFNAVSGAIKSPLQDALNFVGGLVGQFINVGGQIINGIVQGVRNGSNAVVDTVKRICNDALDAVKRFFGIKSPSKVMAGIGDFLMQGLAQGITNNSGEVVNAATAASQLIVDALNTQASATISPTTANSVSPVSTAGNGVIINQTNINQQQIDMDAANRDLGWRLANA